jgi:hypothetical protein
MPRVPNSAKVYGREKKNNTRKGVVNLGLSDLKKFGISGPTLQLFVMYLKQREALMEQKRTLEDAIAQLDASNKNILDLAEAISASYGANTTLDLGGEVLLRITQKRTTAWSKAYEEFLQRLVEGEGELQALLKPFVAELKKLSESTVEDFTNVTRALRMDLAEKRKRMRVREGFFDFLLDVWDAMKGLYNRILTRFFRVEARKNELTDFLYFQAADLFEQGLVRKLITISDFENITQTDMVPDRFEPVFSEKKMKRKLLKKSVRESGKLRPYKSILRK